MDLRELTYVVTIAEEGSISAAAEKLYMAQSSLSQALRQYEAELGTPVFMRTSRGVRPTAAGNAFIERAKQILKDYRLAQNEAWDIEGLHGDGWSWGSAPSGAAICCRRCCKDSTSGTRRSMWKLRSWTAYSWRTES